MGLGGTLAIGLRAGRAPLPLVGSCCASSRGRARAGGASVIVDDNSPAGRGRSSERARKKELFSIIQQVRTLPEASRAAGDTLLGLGINFLVLIQRPSLG